MHTQQYTIRNIPRDVDRSIRKYAQISGKSINQVIVDKLTDDFSQKRKRQTAVESLEWFIGSGSIGDDVLKALEEEDKIQKELTRKSYENDN